MSGDVLVEKTGGAAGAVLTLRINRPDKKNALTTAMYGALADGIEGAGADPDIRAVRVIGVPGAFSAGNDLADFLAFARDGALGDEVIRFLKAVAGCDLPLIAGVDGLAIGVGTTMLFHCDYVVASTRSRFQTPFTDLGLVPEAASSLLAPRLMGHQRAFRLLVLGEALTPEAARDVGLVTELVEVDAAGGDVVDARSLDIAEAIAAKPRGAVAAARSLLRSDREAILERIDAEADVFRDRLTSTEAQDAFAAFFDRAKARAQ